MLAGEITLVVDDRILQEYREVLARPRFAIGGAEREAVLGFIAENAERVSASALPLDLPDPDDAPFWSSRPPPEPRCW